MFTIEINQSELTKRIKEAKEGSSPGDVVIIETNVRPEPENLILPISVRLEIKLDEVQAIRSVL